MSKFLKLYCLPLVVALAGCASTGEDLTDPNRFSAKELYEQAQRAASRGEYNTALETLQTLQTQYPFADYAVQAQLDAISINFRAEEMDAAITAADRFIRLNPTHPRVDYAYYMRAWANAERGSDLLARVFPTDRALRDPAPLRQAYTDFQRVATQYADGPYAEDSELRMERIRNLLARHELSVARYYLDRHAYVAATNRALTVVQEYQETDAAGDALGVLAEAYERLDMENLRSRVLEVIQQNFPNHPLARQAG